MSLLQRLGLVRRAGTATVVVTALVATFLVASAPPAHASCPDSYESEQALSNAPTECRYTFVIHKEPGQLLTRADLLRHADYYGLLGFNRNFLLHAPDMTIDVGPDSQGTWAYCTVPHTGPCPPDKLATSTFGATFSSPTTLHAIGIGDDYITLVCGNPPSKHADAPSPSPTISGVKVHDTNANGVADDGEQRLEGWTITLRLLESAFPEVPEFAHAPERTATTDHNGAYSFSLSNQPPGLYEVEETLQSGWQGSAPVKRQVFVPPGSGDKTFEVDFANVQQADVAKIDMSVVDASTTRLEVGQTSRLTVRSVLRNEGPTSPVEVEEALVVTGREDCTITPQRRAVRRRLEREDEDVVVDLVVDVRCDQRSFHDFTFRNEVRLVTAGVVDPDLTDNTRELTVTLPVFEPADLRVDNMTIECGERYIGPGTFVCDVNTTVANGGPGTAVATLTDVRLTAPAACGLTPAAPYAYSRRLDAGEVVVLASEWTVDCSDAHRHSLVADAVIAVDMVNDPHAEDRNPANNRGSVRWVPLDVKPHSDPSSINATKQGVVPVAILSTPEFDALAEIDTTSLRFGATGTEASLLGCKAEGEDVDGEGTLDLVCLFSATLTGFTCGDNVGVLTGRLLDGTPITGHDTVKITGCRH